MTKSDDGGPAHPQHRIWNAQRAEYEDTEQYPGMTLRDYFAAAALPASIAKCLATEANDGETIHQMLARRSYEMADAMLAERSKV